MDRLRAGTYRGSQSQHERFPGSVIGPRVAIMDRTDFEKLNITLLATLIELHGLQEARDQRRAKIGQLSAQRVLELNGSSLGEQSRALLRGQRIGHVFVESPGSQYAPDAGERRLGVVP